MQYLFFDIECSDGRHICSFGYCLTDERFNVIKKEDIVINPESRFVLANNRKRPKINLAYSEEYFNRQNNFYFNYPKIKEILTRENQILCGHSILSDFHFLHNACIRYSLPNLQLKGFDIQKLYQLYFKKPHVQSLENILIDLNMDIDKIKFHKSCDDAYATMLVAKEICRIDNNGLLEIANKFQNCIIDGMNLNIKKKAISFIQEVNQLRGNLRGENKKKIAFSEDFKLLERKEQIEIIKKIFAKGYDWTSKIAECDIFVFGRKRENRENFCDKLIEKGIKIKKISQEDFYGLVLNKNDKLNAYGENLKKICLKIKV